MRPTNLTRLVLALITTLALAVAAGCGDRREASDRPPARAASTDPEAPVSGDPGRPAPGAGRGTVEGTVRDAAGAPVAGALVVPVPRDDPAPAVPERAVLSGPDGRYTWTLVPGSYEMTASRDGVTLGAATVVVAGGDLASADIAVGR